ncbi:hypothetical protein I307_03459 [Cryptococcus deuterogattii 99/473]|uniref:Copper acquisition factor BIM1-like domain-containing protein n=1 Tax=Cryptococcus deuterogattii Ram5 TaxID=1296110 RepID=A0A0D0VAK9_9TREE|nr:hypothetical protein I309_00487 [Cryptococcus deuterogattii LA55]KIR36988.1 hypothetical protein I352_00300 [Cryptococcus deuterogattii MMRL2647]KIR43459.1 hypothetical protein I313_00301 [Cryptococcus deuterogattii Ram5]KIR74792.1 hypothetical protein I310_01066 [Cryptococcus deuterogattii CA1014]KIR92281.1 hypothetical protein I304_03685 [Cryptococcus deuterogattii CBS 10090]KIS01447.1 hypothetical protein L804_01325 [Cryptococcus deuterogattii 2001/935-1]KIY57125.1 hypothetical protein 
MFALKSIFVTSLIASTALAHFTLDYPQSRGFQDDIEVQIDSHHTLATVVAFISTNSNPTSFNDFNTTSNGTSIPLASSIFQVAQGERCFNIDLKSLNIGLTNGSEVTLQVQYNGGDGNLYQCSDLVLIEGYEVPSNETCTNDASKASNASSTSSSSASATSAAATTSSSATSGAMKEVVGLSALSLAFGIAGLLILLATCVRNTNKALCSFSQP